jgi:Tol biopolymer transport system component
MRGHHHLASHGARSAKVRIDGRAAFVAGISLVLILAVVLAGRELGLWPGARSRGEQSPGLARLSGRLVFVRADPREVMVAGETGIAADPRLVIVYLREGTVHVLASGGDVGRPAVSPDGSRVVFPWARRLGAAPPVLSLYRVGTNGTGLTRLTACRPPACLRDTSPSWSPDGTHIAFVRSSSSTQRIFLLDVRSGRVNPMHVPGRVPFGGASWSPDGRWLVFAAYPVGASLPPEIYVVRTDGTHLRRITSCRPPCRGGYADPAWSPDGNRIAAVQGYGGRGHLVVMAPDGSSLVQLTSPSGEQQDQEPTWSADGAWIVFARGGDFGGDLYAVRPDGTGLRRLTSGPEWDESPAWVPAPR